MLHSSLGTGATTSNRHPMMNGNGATRAAHRQKQMAVAQAAQTLSPTQDKIPHFATTSLEILQKYSKYPALVSLHIFENHYRFNNSQDSQVIPKDLPMIKDFMQHVLKETIPSELLELVKDFSIRLYDGCLILQVYDHRHMVDVLIKQANGELGVTKKPKTYRTLLRPTQLLIYYDLLYHTDAAMSKFTDPLSLQMELEILTLTNRNLDLSVPLNPYLCEDYLQPELEYPKKVWNEAKGDYDLVYGHRDEVVFPPRKLHQDEIVLHKLSDYEEIMLLMSNKYRGDGAEQKLVVVGQPAIAGAAPGSTLPLKQIKDAKKDGMPLHAPTVKQVLTAPPRTTGQFMRLRLIEEYRKKKDAKQAAQVRAINLVAPPMGGAAATMIPPQGMVQAPTKAKLVPPPPQHQPPPRQMKQEMIPPSQQPPMQQQMHPGPPPQPPAPIANQQYSQQQVQAHQQQLKRQKVAQPQLPPLHMGSMPGTPAMGTPVMGNGNMPQQPFMGEPMPQAPIPQQVPPPQQQTNQQRTNLALQQQRQILQNTLSPEEQQVFRQLQVKIQGYQQMANTGVAPNGQQLTTQQKQTALNHAKAYQHQLIQKFPLYFQRVSQFRMLQQQRQQQQQNMMQQQRR